MARGPFGGDGRRRVVGPALLVSLAVHAAVLAGARRGGAAHDQAIVAPPSTTVEDVWAGRSPEATGGRELVDVDVAGPAALAPAAPPAPTPPAAPAAPAAREAIAAAPHANAKAPPPRAKAPPREAPERPAARTSAPTSEAPARAPRRPGPPQVAAKGDDANAAGGGNAGAYGAEAVGGVRDLARAFTRAIPPACDQDAAWKAAPIGAVGSLRVVVSVDERGHVERFEVTSKDPPKALLSLVRRTLALLDAGTFSIRTAGKAEPGAEELEVSAQTSDVGDEEEGPARFGLRYAWEGGRGTASFTQLGGRHVDVRVRLVSARPDR
jgi:hypothetical protein